MSAPDKKLFTIADIREQPSLLESVKLLRRENARTLGPFPDGAFEDYARRGWIRVAMHHRDVLGYLLFREVVTRNEVAIVHLCVSKKAQGQGVARDLLTCLKANTQTRKGIGLWCRADYVESAMWPKLGFVAWKERAGRSRDGSSLVFWWLDHGHTDLLDIAADAQAAERLLIALNANVFFDLEGPKEDGNSESHGLLADWLQPQISLCITPELLNEINKNMDSNERSRQRTAANNYRILKTRSEDFDNFAPKLNHMLGPANTSQDEADRRHLVHALIADVDYFATRDTLLLEKGAEIYDVFGLTLVRPSVLISEIDALIRERDYNPKRLMGCHLLRIQSNLGTHESIGKRFLSNATGERLSEIMAILRRLGSIPRAARSQTIVDAEGRAIGLLGYENTVCGEQHISLCRVYNGTLARTLASQLLDTAIREAIENRISVIRFRDAYSSQQVKDMLHMVGFRRVNGEWIKLNIASVSPISELVGNLRNFRSASTDVRTLSNSFANVFEDAKARGDIASQLAAERVLRPLKASDIDAPTYVIPIEAVWAMALFDDGLASRELLSDESELMLRRCNAYYRAARPGQLQTPGRILWYVKCDKKRPGTMAIRAASYLDDVVIDTPKRLYKRFRRLGVYTWRDIMSFAGTDPDAKIMALAFSDTERLNRPLPFEEVQLTLESHGQRRNQFQAPVKISTDCFVDLYNKALK